ncbi:MAG: endolytic transglycosylase MltG [Acidobacteriota bacterium]
MTRTTRVLLVILALGLGALALGGATLSYLATPFGSPGGEPIVVSVPSGASAKQVATLLESKGVVSKAWAFAWFLRLSGSQNQLKAGEYAFSLPLSPTAIARKLSRGEMNLVSVTIPEGLTLAETAKAIASSGLAQERELIRVFGTAALVRDLDPAARDLEGYLFPETYRFAKGVSVDSIAKTIVDTFRQRFVQPEAGAIAGSGRTMRQLVTIASLVEKETAVGEERARIAGVIADRLAINMPLQIDPTVIYARKLAGTWDGDIKRADLAWNHPYNTYVHRGLPPGPVASAGLAALQAALAPQRTGALYYVSRGDGTHEFSKTLADHSRAVRRYVLQRGR